MIESTLADSTLTDSLAWLDVMGRGVGAWTLSIALWCAAVFLACVVIDRLIARRVGAGVRIALYSLLLIRVAVPLGWSSPVGLVPAAGGAQGEVSVQTMTMPSESDAVFETVRFDGTPTPAEANVIEATGSSITAWVIVLPLWVAGSLGIAALIVRGRRRVALLTRVGEPVDARVAEFAPHARIVQHPAAGPMVAGLFSPTIVIPAGLDRRIDREQLAAVIRHEAAHIKRKDHIMLAFMQAVLCVLWPVAPLWFGAARVRQLMEEACDEHVLADATPAARASYGRALLDMAQWLPRQRLAAAQVSLGFALGIKERFGALRHSRRWSTPVQVVMVMISITAIAACAAPQQQASGNGSGGQSENAQTKPEKPRLASPFGGQPTQPSVPVLTDVPLASSPFGSSAHTQKALAIECQIIDGWPAHAALDFDVAQYSTGAGGDERVSVGDGRSAIVRTLTPAQLGEVLAAMRRPSTNNPGSKASSILSAVQIRTMPGQQAAVAVGPNDPETGKRGGFEVAMTLNANKADYEGTVSFMDFGNDEKHTHVLRNARVLIPRGEIAAVLVTPGLIGGSYRLLLINPTDVDELSTTKGTKNSSGRGTSAYPQVMFMANLCEVEPGRAVHAKAIINGLGGMNVTADGLGEGVSLHLVPEEHFRNAHDQLRAAGGWQNITVTQALAQNGQSVMMFPSGKGGGLQPRELSKSSVGVKLTGNAAKSDGELNGGMEVFGSWNIGDDRVVNIPSTLVQNYDAAAHHMMLVVIAAPKPGTSDQTRLLFLRPRLIRSDADMPRQTLTTTPRPNRAVPSPRPAPPMPALPGNPATPALPPAPTPPQ